MRPRHLLVALIAPALLALPAEAAPRRDPCARLVADARGDTLPLGDDLDVLSASLALDPSTLTITLTLAGTPPTGRDPRMPEYVVGFSTDTTSWSYVYRPWSAIHGAWDRYVTVGRNTVVWQVPRAESALPDGAVTIRHALAETYVEGQRVDLAERPRSRPVQCGS